MVVPKSQALAPGFVASLNSEQEREKLKEFDQLTVAWRKENTLVGLREGDFWRFKPSYKYRVGEVDQYRFVAAAYVVHKRISH